VSVVRSSGGRGDRWDSKVPWPGFVATLVMSIIVVYPRVACQLIGARETFFASRKGASKRLLSGVCTDVASLWLRLELIRSDL